MEDGRGHGVEVRGGGSVQLEKCTVARCRGAGIVCVGAGSKLQAQGAEVRENKTHGVWAEEEARVELEGCCVMLNKGSGCLLARRAFASVSSTVSLCPALCCLLCYRMYA
jgi:hypothetical protein